MFSEATFATIQFKSRVSSISSTAQYILDNEDNKEQVKEGKKGLVHCSIYIYTCTSVWLNRNPELLDV